MVAKRLRVFSIAIALILLFTGTANALEVKTSTVLVHYNNNIKQIYETAAKTVGEFLQEQDIVILENDIITPPLDALIADDLVIEIDRSFTVYVKMISVEGEELIPVETNSGSALSFISKYAAETNIKYVYNYAKRNEVLKPFMIIELKPIVTVTKSVLTKTPFEETVFYCDTMYIGNEDLAQEGQPGINKVTESTIYQGSEEVISQIESVELIQEPVDQITYVGTKPTPTPVPTPTPTPKPTPKPTPTPSVRKIGNDEFEFKQELVMTSTAYTSNYNSTGKNPGDPGFGICFTGMKAQYGVVAVDPNVIPLYTRLYIEGYGYAIAGDIGGAIKGNKIDLYFDTEWEVLNYGRQQIKVYILK